jgi:ABC-type phosphate transport system substrate-binding protein
MSKTFKRSIALKAGAVLAAIGLVAGGSTTSSAAGVTLTASGSTAIKNLLDVCIPAYAK